MKKERRIELDVIRCIALICVISVHYFMYNGFYYEQITTSMYIEVIIRSASMICVPLFLLLTGYLNNKKEIGKKYYIGIIRILLIYLFASLICAGYRNYWGDGLDKKEIIKGIFNYSLAPYGWYVEMYIGIFLLIPFFNVLWKTLKYRNRIILIFTLMLLTAFPMVINVYNFEVIGWWEKTALSSEYLKIVPAYWVGLWPLTYYFIGAWLCENSLKIGRMLNVVLIMVSVLGIGTYNYWRSYSVTFAAGLWQEYGSLFYIILSVLCFNFIKELDFSKAPNIIKKIIYNISDVSFGAYLVSYCLDNYLYRKTTMLDMHNDGERYCLWILFSLIGSCLIANLLNFIYRLLNKLLAFFLKKVA